MTDRLKYYLRWDDPFVKNDYIELPCQVNVDISTWKIRAELYDKVGNCVKLATDNVTGGATTQIEITNGASGNFTVKIPKNQTDCFQNNSFIEIEREDVDGNIRTIVHRKFPMIDDELEWTDNT